MHPKHKGALAEMQASAWLLEQGYEVFRNVSQAGVADLIAWRPGETPFAVEVRRLFYRVSRDGKSCSVAVNKKRHPDVCFLYAHAETGHCSFELEPLIAALGYTLRPPPRIRVVCTVEGCDRKHGAKGLCKMHYDRWRLGLVDGASLAPQP